MHALEARNRRFLADLFAGPFRGHAIIVSAPHPGGFGDLGDFTLSKKPVKEWVPCYVRQYEARARQMEQLDDDAVPYVGLNTHTGLFAAAFGCPIHVYVGQETNPAARPIVRTAEEADKLREPGLDAAMLARVLELARLLRKELGPEAAIGVPDIQSPFDVAALIWNKEEMFPAMIEEPEAVKRLVDKCHRLLKKFLLALKKEVGEVDFCHCPYAWAPPEQGCWLSEDEVGALNTKMFEEFCLPVLTDLSRTFGGLFMHCCANADHQYGGFNKIPSLRGLNRVFQSPGPRPAIDAFAGKTVLIQAWSGDELLNQMLDAAQPDSRFLFNLDGGKLEEIQPRYERLRKRCPRR